MAVRLPTATRNQMCDAAVDLIDVGTNGTLKIYTGTQPATADTAASGTLLATFALPDPAFGASSSGTATLLGVPLSTTGAAAGTAGWFRVEASAPTTIFDGAVGATGSGAELELNTTTISVGVNVSITSGTFTMPAG
jgi:hypothetical protein